MDDRPPLLYLVHRIPYPPNKGDKLRSFHILRQLARNHRVYLGTFVDRAEDAAHVDTLREWCADVCAIPLSPARARLASLRGLPGGEALSLPYYRSRRLRDWVDRTVRTHAIRRAVAFSGPMAQYLDHAGLERRVVDFCDVDSAKWADYARARSWPMSWLYRREGEKLLAFERGVAAATDASIFVTEAEADLFRRAAPETAGRVVAMPNGVDAGFFTPDAGHADPYPVGGPVVVFTGAMDYWPNVDAVVWFVQEILPLLQRSCADLRFYIVGMNPAPAVLALAGPAVVVTGSVPDVRPWIGHAQVVAAPLRIARGIQNKVLEAMAMARPVVVSASSATGLAGEPGRDFEVAATAGEFAARISGLLGDPERAARMGACARARVLASYSWEAHLGRLDALLDAASGPAIALRGRGGGASDDDPRPLVVHVVYRFDVGGLENGVVNLINRLPVSRFRHAIVALTECDPAFCKRIVHDDVRFISLHKPPGHGLKLYPALFRLFSELRPAVVHTRNLAALEAVVPAWAAGVPVRVHGEHGWDVSDPHGTRRRFQWMRRLYRPFVTHYIPLSDHLLRYLNASVGVSAAHMTRICNGVDTQRFRPGARGREVLDGSPFEGDELCVIGTVGRLEPIKDPLNLLRAFVHLLRRAPELAGRLRLMFVGDGSLRAELEAEVARAGVGACVWLVGERRDVPEALRAMDVFVLPSRAEGISNTILEAMACGLPVIATRVGGNAELVLDGETGILVPASDSDALADALARYVGDGGMLRRHGEAGRQRAVEEFSIDGMVARYAQLYESLLSAAGRAVPAT
ncbi:TIGR03087 family PEP-CTERM/XrtA system glycosyltransferase [Aromatoleum evansii]|uniref:TIGR03087 family PEP-CTERM/XrtA system glycosyltransferase n=1 Tax=Aromatoleum evansii TaxID=59406 RepID=A0ABZ1AI59_AROEV|nr:TIGR03087 family PEP-CTERM/XrtA system glycosyltransferase [Aromatoleum evansii]WRL45558.1 TIGR03087 family PEP-CTERM/XrtA system glycosyltransferase [Aromatoleum evansii]